MGDASQAPRRYGILARAVAAAARWLGTWIFPGRWWCAQRLAGRGLRGRRVEIPVPGLPAALDGLRIVQISDLHAGPWMDEGALDPVRDLVVGYEPDLLVITGDFITDSADDFRLLGTFFARLPAALGKYAVLGNHDHRQRRAGEILAGLRRQGVTLLVDRSVAVERGGARLRLVGLDDIEEGRGADLGAALVDARPGDGACVLLCHHPDVTARLPPGRFDLVLCGHTHGGQVRWPWSRVDAPAGRCRAGTHALPGGGWLHVNRGVGTLCVPLRIGAPAEVSCLVLRPAAGASRG